MVGGACTPVAPVGNADSLDDEDDHLAEEDEKEEEEADGAVGPETGNQEIQSEGSRLKLLAVLVPRSHLKAL